jgi:F0F1-type ATP synthase membrane subunit b/b'
MNDFFSHILDSNAINVLIVLAGLSVLARKMDVMGRIEQGRQTLIQELERLKEQRVLAEQEFSRAEQVASRSHQEITLIQEEAQKQAHTLEEKLLKEAQQAQARYLMQYRHQIDQHDAKLQQRLAASLVTEAVSQAKASLSQELTPELHRAIYHQSIQAVAQVL